MPIRNEPACSSVRQTGLVHPITRDRQATSTRRQRSLPAMVVHMRPPFIDRNASRLPVLRVAERVRVALSGSGGTGPDQRIRRSGRSPPSWSPSSHRRHRFCSCCSFCCRGVTLSYHPTRSPGIRAIDALRGTVGVCAWHVVDALTPCKLGCAPPVSPVGSERRPAAVLALSTRRRPVCCPLGKNPPAGSRRDARGRHRGTAALRDAMPAHRW